MKFLHISDIHLGNNQYQNIERMKDFARSWIDVLQRYAIDEKVDFVLMGGDFFHKRNVEPQAMNHAVAGLTLLREAGIPVVAIEGNHDQHAADSSHSWLRSLSSWGFLKLLEPEAENGKINYEMWDETGAKGSFIDIGKARIFGSQWYGASTNAAIPLLIEGIKENRRDDGAFHILMLHTDIEGHEIHRHHIPAMSQASLRELKSVTEYIALGHTHKRIEIDNWAFNPGSLESCTIDEYKEIRGAYLIEVDETNQVTAKFIDDYVKRPFERVSFDVSGKLSAPEITHGVLEMLEREVDKYELNAKTSAPIIEISLRGYLGFPNSLLELDEIRTKAKDLTNALQIRLNNRTFPVEYAVAADADIEISREDREKRVIEDLIVRDNRFKQRAEQMAEVVIGAKKMALGEEDAEKILDFISLKTA